MSRMDSFMNLSPIDLSNCELGIEALPQRSSAEEVKNFTTVLLKKKSNCTGVPEFNATSFDFLLEKTSNQ